MSTEVRTPLDMILSERWEWQSDGARCHFCRGPAYPWVTDDETWAKVEPLLGQQQACFECFVAAWFILGLNNGEPFTVAATPPRPASEPPQTDSGGDR